MRFLIVFLICFSFIPLQAQEKNLEGIVQHNNVPLENVPVQNISTKVNTLTNSKGLFSISAKVGDTLLFSHVSMNDVIMFLKEADFSAKPLKIEMLERGNELDEVLITDEHEINAVSLGLIPKAIPKPTSNERKLQTASKFHPTFGTSNSISLDPIINWITGKTKKLKRIVEMDNKRERIAFLENNYFDYMREEMQMTAEEIHWFLSMIVENKNLKSVLDSDNEQHIQFYLQDNWLNLKESRLTD